MPHGGGHHGGGHHGGGHHGGGGFRGGGFHRHHHHHHHRHGGYVGFYGTPYYGYRRRPFSWVIFSVFIIVIIIITTSVTVRYTASGDDDNFAYGPTDTRVVSVSNTLCEKVKFTARDPSDSGYEIFLYTLSSPPKLTGRESFNLNEQPSFSHRNEFNHYYYYMPKGSNISMSACILDQKQPRITFYFIKGHKNFVSWKDDYGHSIQEFIVNTRCESGNSTYHYSVSTDDFYYLVFDSDVSSSNAINISMYFDRTRYEVDNNDTVIDSCSRPTSELFSDSGCSLGLPMSGSTALLKVQPNSDTVIDWLFEVHIDVGCSARIWMYFVISLCVLVGVIGILVAFFAFIYFYCIRSKKTSSTTTTTTAAATTTTTESPANLTADAGFDNPTAPLLHEIPPPSNPTFPPSDYGRNYGDAPPPYKK